MSAVVEFLSNNMSQLLGGAIATLVAYFGIRIQERARLQQYFGELRVWALAVLDDLSEAAHLCLLDPVVTQEASFYNRKHDLLIRLSAKIDQGRLFFPSTKPVKFSKWRLDPAQSFQRGPLNILIYAYGAVKQMSYTSKEDNDHLWEPLITAKRDFTGAMQIILDPRNKNKQFELAMEKRHANKNVT